MEALEIQKALNILGFGPIAEDGRFGPETTKAVERFQRAKGLTVDGIAGPNTLSSLFDKKLNPRPFIRVSEDSVNLIIFSEVTSELEYRKKYSRPNFPGQHSGVTIGIGYDLGYNSPQQIREDWQDLVDDRTLRRLISCTGLKGSQAKRKLPDVADINIPFHIARKVFLERTLPRYAKEALIAYPGLDKLHPNAAGAIVSLVFNRGTSFRGDKRVEMAALKPVIAAKDYKRMSQLIRQMKRLWDGIPEKDGRYEPRVMGLLFRRDGEADLALDYSEIFEHTMDLFI